MGIEQNIAEIESRIHCACERAGRLSEEVTLVAVTKTVEPSRIREAYRAGLRHFGENRVQEAQSKLEELADLRSEVTWHMIGHLQTNKVKTALALFDIIHSIDSLKLAEVVSRRAERVIPVLIEVNVAGEATKSGFTLDELTGACAAIAQLPNLQVEGLMTVAPWVDDPEEIRPVFRKLRELRDALGLKHLSMGMTDDFEVAIEEGATIIRVGRAIFGERRG